MKVSLYLCLTGFFVVLAQREARAQETATNAFGTAFRKGVVQLTATYGYGQGQLVRNRDVVKVQAGYYVADRLLLGAVGSLTKEWNEITRSNRQFSIGPLVRYQVTATRLSPFVSLAYQFGKPTFSSTADQAVFVAPGLNFALIDWIRLEASYELLVAPSSERIGQAQVGATFLFGAKK